MNKQALIYLTLLQFTHWAADYTHLSTKWMLAAKRLGKPLGPILAHATVHATLVGIVTIPLVIINPDLWLELMALQLISHFLIDVLKGRMNGWFPSLQSPANIYHWYVFGFDQLLNQIVLITIIYLAS